MAIRHTLDTVKARQALKKAADAEKHKDTERAEDYRYMAAFYLRKAASKLITENQNAR